jgi:hypothetical protein
MIGHGPRCRSCHAEIWFGLTAKGKRMPIDPQPCEEGNVILDVVERALTTLATMDDPAARALTERQPPPVRTLHKGEAIDPDVPRYRSHFATCPNAERHRRKAPA